MIEPVNKECTYSDLVRLTGRRESRIRTVARELGCKPKRWWGQRIFSPEAANTIIRLFNKLDAAKNRNTMTEGLMTIEEITAKTGMSCAQISARLGLLHIKPAGRIRSKIGTWYVKAYSADDLPRIVADCIPLGTRARAPHREVKRPPELLTIRELAERTHSSVTEICAAIKAINLPAVKVPSHEHRKMMVNRYRFQHINCILAEVQRIRKSAGTPAFTRRAPEEED